jgi:hypothetical protein
MKTRLEMMIEVDRLRRTEPGSDFDSFVCGAIVALEWAMDREERAPSSDLTRLLEVTREARRDDEKA